MRSMSGCSRDMAPFLRIGKGGVEAGVEARLAGVGVVGQRGGRGALEREGWHGGSVGLGFGESEELQREFDIVACRAVPAGLEVERVVAHEHGELMRRGRGERTDGDLDGPPLASPTGHKVAADAFVKIAEERFVEAARVEILALHGFLQPRDPLGEERG